MSPVLQSVYSIRAKPRKLGTTFDSMPETDKSNKNKGFVVAQTEFEVVTNLVAPPESIK